MASMPTPMRRKSVLSIRQRNLIDAASSEIKSLVPVQNSVLVTVAEEQFRSSSAKHNV
jgi:hypothetical protein